MRIFYSILFFVISLLADSKLSGEYALSQPEIEYLQKHKSITFTGDPNWLPFEAFEDDGKYIGIVADHLKYLEKTLDVKFDKQVSKTWSDALNIATKGKADVISGDSSDAILNKQFTPIDAYLENPIMIIMKSNNLYVGSLKDISDKKIAIIKDYGYTADIYRLYPNIDFIEVENVQDGLIGIETGKYDAMLASLALASYSIVQMALEDIAIVGKTNINMKVTLFVHKNKPLLHSTLNKAMHSLDKADQLNILLKWRHKETLSIIDYQIVINILIIVGIILLFILYRQMLLKRAEHVLEEKSNLLHDTINSVENIIFVKNNEFKYIECNSAFEAIIGLSRDEIIGKDDYDFFSKKEADFFREKDEAMLASKKTTKNNEWVTNLDGSKTYVVTTKAPLRDSKGNILGLVGNAYDLTKEKELEEKLNISIKQFELFMNNIPYAVVIKDASKKVIYANENVKKYLTKDTVGKNTRQNLGERIASKVDALIEEATLNEKAEKIIKDELNGQKYIARVMAFNIPYINGENYTGIIYADITEDYENQYEVSRLKSALDRSPVSIVMTDLDGNMEYVNSNYIKVTGYSREELMGHNPRLLKSGETSLESYKKMWECISTGEIWTSDIKNIAKDGSEFWENSTILPSFDDTGIVNGYIAFKLEITEQVYIKEKLRSQEELLISQSRHAAMGEMISMIAHQWRQPITVIAMGANNILVDVDLEEFTEDSLRANANHILDQTQYLSKTIDDFRNFFRPDKEKENVNIKTIIDETLEIIGKSLQNSNVLISVEEKHVEHVMVYSRELLQVFMNLLKNSKEALVENREEDRKIDVVINGDKNNILISVCDNGGGISEENISKIFNPYFSTKNKQTGTGIGLYMCKTIINKHLGGSIDVECENGNTCFKILIPKNK